MQAAFNVNVTALTGPDGILLVDTGMGVTADSLAASLDRLGNGNIRLVVLTHIHGDHTGGSNVVARNSTIISHGNVRERQSSGYYNLRPLAAEHPPYVTFEDSLTIHMNCETIKLTHIPNVHTDGDVFVHFTKANIISVGDLIFPEIIPFVDEERGGSVERYIQNVDTFIRDLPPDIRIIAGHGREYSIDDLREYKIMLNRTSARVKGAIKAGNSLDDMVKEKLLADWESWNGVFNTTTVDYWIGTIYRGFTNNKLPGIKSICEPLTRVIVAEGIDATVVVYYNLKETEPENYSFAETELNMLGYQLLMRQMLPEAVRIFRINVEEYPASFNVYDSYGESLVNAGDTAQAIMNYERSLEINPDNENAVRVLEQLHKK